MRGHSSGIRKSEPTIVEVMEVMRNVGTNACNGDPESDRGRDVEQDRGVRRQVEISFRCLLASAYMAVDKQKDTHLMAKQNPPNSQ